MNRDDILPGTVLTVPGGADIMTTRRRSAYRLIVEQVMPPVAVDSDMLYVVGWPIRLGGELSRRYSHAVHRVLWLDQVRPDPHIRVLHLTPEHPQYRTHLAHMSAPKLAREWHDDAESEAVDGVSFLMVTYDGQPAAWAGYQLEGDRERVLRCRDNYVVRDFRHVKPGLWALAYLARHQLIVSPWKGFAYTYVYTGEGQPALKHMANGWRPDLTVPADQREGISRARPDGEDHHWVRLVRQAL